MACTVELPVVQTSSTMTTRAPFSRKPSMRCTVPSRLAVPAERAVERYAVQVAAIAPYLAKCVPALAVVEHGTPSPVVSK